MGVRKIKKMKQLLASGAATILDLSLAACRAASSGSAAGGVSSGATAGKTAGTGPKG